MTPYVTINRDLFARQETVRKLSGYKSPCDWCGACVPEGDGND